VSVFNADGGGHRVTRDRHGAGWVRNDCSTGRVPTPHPKVTGVTSSACTSANCAAHTVAGTPEAGVIRVKDSSLFLRATQMAARSERRDAWERIMGRCRLVLTYPRRSERHGIAGSDGLPTGPATVQNPKAATGWRGGRSPRDGSRW